VRRPAIAHKRKKEDVPAAPSEARRVVIGLSAAEVALALLVAWLVLRLDVGAHARLRAGFGVGDVVAKVGVAACLGIFVFVIGVWQWRLAGRDRVRLLLTVFVSLAAAFYGLCWYDVALRTAEIGVGAEARSTVQRIIELSVAETVLVSSLLVGLVAVTAEIWVAHRALNPPTRDGIVESGE